MTGSTARHLALAGVLSWVLVLATAAGTARAAEHASGDRDAAQVAPRPSAGCHAGGDLAQLTGDRRTITVGGDARSYFVDAPAGAADRPLPVVMVFHGFGGNAAQMRAGAGIADLAQRERFIAIHPDGHEGVQLLGRVGRGWDLGPQDTRDTDFVRAMLDRIASERCVDLRRVYATGMSNGGFVSNLLGCRLADRFAAVAPVAGTMPLTGCTPSEPVAVMLTHGRADDIVPPSLARDGRDWWAAQLGCHGPATSDADASHDGCTRYTGCSADLVYCEGPQAHAWPPDTSERIWRFFVAHPKR